MRAPPVRRRFALVAAFLAGVLLAALAARLGDTPARAAAGKLAGIERISEGLPLDALAEFAAVLELIKNNYVDEKSGEELVRSAIRGMVARLDPHSSYFSAEEFSAFRKGLAGTFGGIGIFVGERDGWVEVVSPIDDTPAARANIRAGGIIVEINGQTTRGMSLDEAVSLMRGEPDTRVTLKYAHPAEQKPPRTVVLRREVITSPSVRAARLADNFGYIRIVQFQPESTVPELVKRLNALATASPSPLRGLVLDLRNNPGGDLHSSVGVASAFVPYGRVVVSDRGRDRSRDHTFHSEARRHLGGALREAGLWHKMPMVVLINGGSASAAEIVAGALKDHHRAVVVGARSYGKGSVQSLMRIPVGDKSAVKLTTARYFTPSGESIHKIGVTPDLLFEEEMVNADENFAARDATFAERLRAAAAAVSKPDVGEEAVRAEEKRRKAAGESPFLPLADFGFNRAMAVLKAMAQPATATAKT